MTKKIDSEQVPFNRPYMTGRELTYISEAHRNGMLSGDGPFTRRCEQWIEATISCRKALLTHSCTAGLEMAALLAEVGPGDEVIMPSFTFVSTANAFVLRGATPVFVDIREDSFNMDERLLEQAITPRTKAIVPVHYAGVACEMNHIQQLADHHRLLLIEDAAQGMGSSYNGRPLGSIGHLSAFSFHETKNLISGEGGALAINDERFINRAEILREKGTNRKQLLQGLVDKYTWVDVGSSFLPGEIVAAFLFAQLEQAEEIKRQRLHLWSKYYVAFSQAEAAGWCRRPVIPAGCVHNAHIFHLLLPTAEVRSRFIAGMRKHDIHPVFHYIPLHSSPAGKKYGRTATADLPVTNQVSERLVRLPLYLGLESVQERAIDIALQELQTALKNQCS